MLNQLNLRGIYTSWLNEKVFVNECLSQTKIGIQSVEYILRLLFFFLRHFKDYDIVYVIINKLLVINIYFSFKCSMLCGQHFHHSLHSYVVYFINSKKCTELNNAFLSLIVYNNIQNILN